MPYSEPLLATEICLYYTIEHLNQLRKTLCRTNTRRTLLLTRVW